MKMYDLILYDTSNFSDFPIGGQLTSIRNFLKYIADDQPEYVKRILLVGVTTVCEDVGKIGTVAVDQTEFDFLPVMHRERDLAGVKNSLRLEYVKALFRQNRRIHCSKNTIHYIHTPEAYIAVKTRHPFGKTAVFSHGSFFNMVRGFRFFQRNKVIHFCFHQFLIGLLKTADVIFALDEVSEQQYRKHTKKVVRVENSIVLPSFVEERETCHDPLRLLFVGRLSKVKGIDAIIGAVEWMSENSHLSVIGDGEERDNLQRMVREKKLEEKVAFLGALPPREIGHHYQQSDILILNSVLEGKPMTILEAMSYGLPVITTPVGGIAEMVRTGLEAEFTDGSVREIVSKIETIKGNYHDYSQNARNRSLLYDYKKVNGTVFEKLNQL